MISFIVIGKNIENTVKLCIESIFNFIKTNEISNFEIIYVDSGSADDSLKIAMQYPVRVLLIKGEANAAVGRNAGAKYSKGDILFFIDGDMELFPDFNIYNNVLDKSAKKLKYPFINGCVKEIYYDKNFKFLYTSSEKLSEKPYFRNKTGGLTIIDRKLREEIGGMDERLIRNQDIDFGIRMAGYGIPALKDNIYWGIHHTSSYLESGRFLNFFSSKALLSTGLLMRKHIFNPIYLKIYKRNVFYVAVLLISFLIFFYKPVIGFALILFYITLQLIRVVLEIGKELYLLKSFLYKIFLNLFSLIGFFFYFPENPEFKILEKK